MRNQSRPSWVSGRTLFCSGSRTIDCSGRGKGAGQSAVRACRRSEGGAVALTEVGDGGTAPRQPQ
ncbi:MAG: hypothetical protein AAB131_00140, partial [Actinomycetota bacterium]